MRKLSRIVAYLSLSLLIHLGVSELLAGPTMTQPAPRTVRVSLVSRSDQQEPVAVERPRPEPRKKPDPPARPAPVKDPEEEPRESEPVVSNPVVAQPPLSPVPEKADPSPGISVEDSEAAAGIYQGLVLGIIRKNLRYPGNARRRGIEGTVLVSFTIEGAGPADNIRIVTSSGAALLDKASLETIRRCSFPPPPKAPLTLSVPITFRLTGEM